MVPIFRRFPPAFLRIPSTKAVFVKRALSYSAIMASASTSAALYAATTAVPQISPPTPDDTAELSHHAKDGKGFVNPWPSYVEQAGLTIMRKMIWARLTGKSKTPDTTPPTVPVHTPVFLPSRETKVLRATWLGHACYYVEFPGGFRALFDPVFTHRCSPFSWLGPARYTEAPCQIDELPYVDAVMISHNHYDHLSHPDVMKIHSRYPNAHFFVPLGNKKWFEACGIHKVTELDWWQSKDITLTKLEGGSEVKVVEGGKANSDPETMVATIGCLPCQHTSARTGWDKARTLWSSWSVESGGKKVWFAGDTGYRTVPELDPKEDDYTHPSTVNLPHCPAFAQIGKLRGPFDLGLIPIGAYSPRYIMSPMHANPFDSVNIFVDTKCKKALGMHWGTWVLTDEDVLEPPRLLKEALKRKQLAETGVFDVVDIGISKEFE